MRRIGTSVLLIFLAMTTIAQDDLPITADIDYVVQADEDLETIAATFDVSVDCLQETNDLAADDTISEGDVLVISVDCPTYSGDLEVENPREAQPQGETTDEEDDSDTLGLIGGSSYTVEAGDTLDTIAQTFDVSLVALRELNDLTDNSRIDPGDVLTIPSSAPPYGSFPALDAPDTGEGGGQGGGVAGELYVVQPGDTLDTIAQEFNVSVLSLQQVNDRMDNVRINPGQTIVIPDGAPEYGTFPPLDLPDTEAGGGVGGGVEGDLYVIQPRDTIDQLGADYNASVNCIVEANEIANVRLILPGQTVVIPSGCPPYTGFGVPRPEAPTSSES